MGADGKTIDSRWHGPGFKVYRNFHMQLTGKSYMLSIYFFIFLFTLRV